MENDVLNTTEVTDVATNKGGAFALIACAGLTMAAGALLWNKVVKPIWRKGKNALNKPLPKLPLKKPPPQSAKPCVATKPAANVKPTKAASWATLPKVY